MPWSEGRLKHCNSHGDNGLGYRKTNQRKRVVDSERRGQPRGSQISRCLLRAANQTGSEMFAKPIARNQRALSWLFSFTRIRSAQHDKTGLGDVVTVGPLHLRRHRFARSHSSRRWRQAGRKSKQVPQAGRDVPSAFDLRIVSASPWLLHRSLVVASK